MVGTDIRYPEECWESIREIMDRTGTDIDTAYAMILITAALMDLKPWDAKVVEMVVGGDDGKDAA